MRGLIGAASAVALAWSGAAMAEEAPKLTLQRVFASPELAGPAPRAALY